MNIRIWIEPLLECIPDDVQHVEMIDALLRHGADLLGHRLGSADPVGRDLPVDVQASPRTVLPESALAIGGSRRFTGLREPQLALGEHVELVDGSPVRAGPLGEGPLALGSNAVRSDQRISELRDATERIVVASDHVERQRVLDRLRVERDAPDADVLPVERHRAGVTVEQPAQNFCEFRRHVAPMRAPAPRRDRLEFRPPRSETETEQEPAFRQPIQRRCLLGENHRIAVGENDDASAEPDPAGLRGRVGKGDHRLVPARALSRAHPALGSGTQEVGRPDRLVAQPFGELDAFDDLIRRGESAGHEDAFATRGDLDVEAYPAHSLRPFPGRNSRARSGMSTPQVMAVYKHCR